VLKVLQRESIGVDCLAGTSMGGVVAAGYAAGLSLEALEQEALGLASARRLLGMVDHSLPRGGLLVGQRVSEHLAAYLGERSFEDLDIPLTLVATDLNSGRTVYLCQGSLTEAVRATISVPGVLAPVERDGQLLVDGGLLDNLPVDAVRRMGASLVIAVDVSTGERSVSQAELMPQLRRVVPNGLAETVEVLGRSAALVVAEMSRLRLAEFPPDVIIRPALPPEITAFGGFFHAAEIIALGEQAAVEALPRLRRALDGLLPKRAAVSGPSATTGCPLTWLGSGRSAPATQDGLPAASALSPESPAR
jgi:NTE family protein